VVGRLLRGVMVDVDTKVHERSGKLRIREAAALGSKWV
jgi:hypothetical protein